jgi:hypothetical protein
MHRIVHCYSCIASLLLLVASASCFVLCHSVFFKYWVYVPLRILEITYIGPERPAGKEGSGRCEPRSVRSAGAHRAPEFLSRALVTRTGTTRLHPNRTPCFCVLCTWYRTSMPRVPRAFAGGCGRWGASGSEAV